MSRRFTDRIALVTGAGSGIGPAAAQVFAREGATVAGRRADALAETIALITAAAGQSHAHPPDITKPDEVERLVHHTVAGHGGLHIASNNAGTVTAGPHRDLPRDEGDTL